MMKPAASLSSSPALVLPPSPSVLTPVPSTRGLSESISPSLLPTAFLVAVFFVAVFLVRALGASSSGSASVAALVVREGATLTVLVVRALVPAGSAAGLAEAFLAAVFFETAVLADTGTGSVSFAVVFLTAAVLTVFATGLATAFALLAAVRFVAE